MSSIRMLKDTVAGAGRGTVIYPNDPERRLEVLWGDEIHRRLLASVLIRERSRWKGWREVHIGMSLKEVEALHEKPFKLTTDFNTDDSDTVTQWQGGAMERVPGGGAKCLFVSSLRTMPRQMLLMTLLMNMFLQSRRFDR